MYLPVTIITEYLRGCCNSKLKMNIHSIYSKTECGIKGQGSRIINGVDAGLGEFPWQISLRFDFQTRFDTWLHCNSGTELRIHGYIVIAYNNVQVGTAEARLYSTTHMGIWMGGNK